MKKIRKAVEFFVAATFIVGFLAGFSTLVAGSVAVLYNLIFG